jgi:hypothetical protein
MLRSGRLLIVLIFFLNLTANGQFDNSWYKNFKGKIFSQGAEMHIIKLKNEVKGYLYYNNYRLPLQILGTVSGDSIQLSAYSNDYETENFNGIFKSGRYSGSYEHWKDTALLSQFNFDFTEDVSASKKFDFEYVTGSIELFKGWKDTPTADYLEGSIWPSESYSNYSFLRNEICSFINMPAGITMIGKELNERKKKYFKDYLETNKDVTKKEISEIGYPSSYSQEEQDITVIAYIDENLAVLATLWYSYLGGAHGNHATSFRTIDIAGKRTIGLKDIVNDDGISALPKLIENHFRIQFDVKESQTLTDWGLLVDTIPVTENVCLTPGCLMFCYAPYEIGPYAMGEAVIYIPVNEIYKYLNPGIKKLIY